MSWPYDLLEVPDDADERSIRRAYVVALKKTRPDEDPEGFQALHEAYRYALSRAGRDSIVAAMPAAAAVETAASAQPLAVVENDASTEPRFDFEDFFAELSGKCAEDTAVDVKTWLRAQPALWRLPLKAQAGQRLLRALFDRQPPMPAETFDTLLAFFDFDRAGAAIDPLHAGWLRHRLAVAWLLRPGNGAALARATTPASGAPIPTTGETESTRRLLTRPFQFWRNTALAALRPGQTGIVTSFLTALGIEDNDVPSPLQAAQVNFWTRLAVPLPIGRERAWVLALRSAFLLLLALLVGLCMLPSRGADGSAWLMPLAFASTLAGMGLAYSGWRQLLWWQGLPDASSIRVNAIRALVVPLLVVVALATHSWTAPGSPHGIGLAVVACIVAIARYAARLERPVRLFQFHWLRLFLLVPLGAAGWTLLGKAGDAIGWIAATALLIWALDLFRLRIRRAARA